MRSYYSHGKLLLSSEYFLLKGATALAIPTRFGQEMIVSETTKASFSLTSLDHDKQVWFSAEFPLSDFHNPNEANSYKDGATQRCFQLLKYIYSLRPDLFASGKAFVSSVNFPRAWGLGTSSTFVNNLATWAEIDPYNLLWSAFRGSGYDIACARCASPILYQLQGSRPNVKAVDFDPPFKAHLFFVYLNKKQDTGSAIGQYSEMLNDKQAVVEELSRLTLQMSECKDETDFCALIEKHEAIIARHTKQRPVKASFFPDYQGSIKSLGAWGGDFILAVGGGSTIDYFASKGYSTVLPYGSMALI